LKATFARPKPIACPSWAATGKELKVKRVTYDPFAPTEHRRVQQLGKN
jgi:hypothetical protein